MTRMFKIFSKYQSLALEGRTIRHGITQKIGVFSVWSTYHLCMDLRRMRADNLESSSSVAEHRGWLDLSDTDVPGKAMIHTWRLIRNGLAVGPELQH